MASNLRAVDSEKVKMDKITYYTYAFGGIEDLKEGNFDSMQTAKSLDSLVLMDLSPIIVPKFIGVYQDWKAKRDSEEEFFEAEVACAKISEIIRTIAASEGENLCIPSLIHLGYDPSYPEEMARELLGENTHRIRTSPYDALPDFGEKNTAEIGCIRQAISSEKTFGGFQKAVRSASTESYDILSIQLSTFGLTTEEYGVLKLLARLRQSEPKKFKKN